jgi:RecA-family ATPase
MKNKRWQKTYLVYHRNDIIKKHKSRKFTEKEMELIKNNYKKKIEENIEAVVFKSSESFNPTITDQDQWCFMDEHDSDPYGPYESKEECKGQLKDYCKRFFNMEVNPDAYN